MNPVTIGGVTAGLAILTATLVRWWPGTKSLRTAPLPYIGQLLPFLAAWAYGVLAILTLGGLVGLIADTALWITSWLGDVALVWGVGGSTGQAASGGPYRPLTQTGGAIVLLMTVAVIVSAKKSSRYGRDITMGTLCGITLGTSAGITGFAAAPLAEAVNRVGAEVYGVIV